MKTNRLKQCKIWVKNIQCSTYCRQAMFQSCGLSLCMMWKLMQAATTRNRNKQPICPFELNQQFVKRLLILCLNDFLPWSLYYLMPWVSNHLYLMIIYTYKVENSKIYCLQYLKKILHLRSKKTSPQSAQNCAKTID